MQATLALIDENGLREVTCEAIARRANVSKATLYKWWPNKTQLALDALMLRVNTEVPVPDTGSAVQDFTLNLKALTRIYAGPSTGSLLKQLMGECLCDASFLVVFRERFFDLRRYGVHVLWERGVERGDIRADVDRELFLDLMYGPMILRLLMGHGPLNDHEAELMVQTAFAGLAPV